MGDSGGGAKGVCDDLTGGLSVRSASRRVVGAAGGRGGMALRTAGYGGTAVAVQPAGGALRDRIQWATDPGCCSSLLNPLGQKNNSHKNLYEKI